MKTITVKNPHDDFRKIVNRLTHGISDRDLQLDLEIHKKLLNIFQVGDYYYYIFNLNNAHFDFLSDEVEQVLGYPRPSLTVNFFMSLIHPDDLPWFLNFENKVVEFFSGLRVEQLTKYKVRYDYRVRKSNGEYIRILQQIVVFEYDETNGGLLRTLGIHTDISHLKRDGDPVLSLIGLEGEPSYVNVKVDKVFEASRSLISHREKQILQLLIEGKNSKAIAVQLFISPETVSKHRRNILRKTQTTSTPELVARAVRDGWL